MEVGGYQNLSEISIKSADRNYTVKFGDLSSSPIKNDYYLVDENLRANFPFPDSRTCYIRADERLKTLQTVEKVLIELNALGVKKDSYLSVIGGGFTQDLGTLVASIYMRGIQWSYIPTTLASMGDSCIGGKSSINAGATKNLVGNFYPPSQVIIDINFCSTLPKLEIVAGLAEIVKICFAKGPQEFKKAIELISLWEESKNPAALVDLVSLSVESKKYFIEVDEFDTGVRRLLNFGHSFGHAIEVSSGFRIPHGVAVLIGMIAAVNHKSAISSKVTNELVEFALRRIVEVQDHILAHLREFDYVVFCEAILRDKKNSNTAMRLILPKDNTLELVEISLADNAVGLAEDAIRQGIGLILNEIC